AQGPVQVHQALFKYEKSRVGRWEGRVVQAPDERGGRRGRRSLLLTRTDRRRFIAAAGAGAAAIVLGAGPYTEKTYAAHGLSAYPFTLGVASGDPTPDGVVLWTRLAPEP